MPTEYDNIDVIGTTHESSKNSTEEKMNSYYHKQEVTTVTDILKIMKLSEFQEIIDLGCSIGTWYKDFKKLGFKRIIGIDISRERANTAKKRGYDEVHVCNAYDLPFENESKAIVISNDVFIHVLQDLDKTKIFNEIKRILKKNGIFIFNIANASGGGYNTDTTVKYCRWVTPKNISNLVNQTNLEIEQIIPSYYGIPRIGAHPSLASIFTKLIFPFIDSFLKKVNDLSHPKVIYFGVRKRKNSK